MNSIDSPRRHSAAETVFFGGLHSPAAARTARRSTADAAKQGWDGRTKVPSAAGLSDARTAVGRTSYAFSRASSDAGSVLDSVSSTPRGRGPTRLQHHHTLQAVASRLQHVQSSGLPYLDHGSARNPRAVAASVYSDYSDTASWADEHREQHAADLAQHQLESKQSMNQLASSLQRLEDTLHDVMAKHTHGTVAQASTSQQHAKSGIHSNTSSVADGKLIAARLQSFSRASTASHEDPVCQDTEEIALAQKAAHIAQWVQQSGTADSEIAQPRTLIEFGPADVSNHGSRQQTGDQAGCSNKADQLVSCQLSHQGSLILVNLHVNPDHSAFSYKQHNAAQSRYAKWLASVSVVEDACSQLNVRNHNPGPETKSVTYAKLLQDCADSALQ